MYYLALPEEKIRPLSFYLAMEEYVARSPQFPDDIFFMWQVEPSVIFGRNQDVEAEVNLDYCRSHGINTFRRKSGGGCVYADWSNVMLSYITREDEVSTTFQRYLDLVTGALEKMGIPATSTEHNDILIDGRKVSGTAFYHLPGASIVHGTMLYSTDMENMLHAITPSKQKLGKHGVQSVRQRITLLKDHTDMPLEEIKQFLRKTICSNEIILSSDDVRQIENLEKEYDDPKWIFRRIN
ncbi:MAG: lipoate--protein ligase family protein [Prevotellaceae bacterium]|nr:lipoate--protein ligase family protein [Prevotellaceae bacterium]